MEDYPERIFRSAKRLIGYDRENTRNSRVISTARGNVTLGGKDAVRMLIDHLLLRTATYFARLTPSSSSAPKINKVVLAVPNTFTPAKIQQMKQCIPPSIVKVDHIYEAEAVLMYYLKRNPDTTGARETERGERVLVFDFGGGSAN